MFDPRKNLIVTISQHKAELIKNVCNRLQKLERSHYEVIDFERHQEREEAMLNALLKGMEEADYFTFLDYMEKIAGMRSNEGYSLDELQNATTVFEEELWHILTKFVPIEPSLVDMLAICNRIFGKAKDHLARTYLKEAVETRKELDDLRKRFFVYQQEKKDVADSAHPHEAY